MDSLQICMVQLQEDVMMLSCSMKVICYLGYKQSLDHPRYLPFMEIQLIPYDNIYLHHTEVQ